MKCYALEIKNCLQTIHTFTSWKQRAEWIAEHPAQSPACWNGSAHSRWPMGVTHHKSGKKSGKRANSEIGTRVAA